ncbi:MerR family transcriptional regulator [Actinomycetospora callitridis]|uniref:MerR family transcriptional regulator n=1 Tax=Actinomycetospora callitridis TaxID=913944 RepID=UPI002366EBF3|nr:MerR family transcriptional regulator [Actinomycetospora callitridis]MDD7918299.1 MerR family transcriptional regulator [Actinomycetospora callitridis]
MTAAGLSEPGGSPLSIGSVLDALRADFPEITISKIRFLESEGLIRPARTPAGYRQFSHADVVRLRFVLSAQRDHYLPLKVIRARLDEFDRNPVDGGPTLPGETPGGADGALATAAPPESGGPGPGGPGGPTTPSGPSAAATARVRSLASVADRVEPDEDPDGARTARGDTVSRDVMLAEDGVDASLLDGLEHHGILRPDADGRYEPEDVLVARTAASLARLGVEPRLLRSARASADREVGLLAQLVTPVARSRGPEAARRAEELSAELAALSGRLHALLVGAGLRHGLKR